MVRCHGTNEAPARSQGFEVSLESHVAQEIPLQNGATTSEHVLAVLPGWLLVPWLHIPSPCTCWLHVAVVGCPPPSLAPRAALFLAPAGCWASSQGKYSVREQAARLAGL